MEENPAASQVPAESSSEPFTPSSKPPRKFNSKILALALAVVLILILGGALILSKQKQAAPSPTPTPVASPTNTPISSPSASPISSSTPKPLGTVLPSPSPSASTNGALSVTYYKWASGVKTSDQITGVSAHIVAAGPSEQTFNGSPSWSGSLPDGSYDIYAEQPSGYNFESMECVGNGCGSAGPFCGSKVEMKTGKSAAIKCWFSN